ncbi:MAG: insulinase family protein [Candidatus Riflebacteria bacterium]|nr:insulinase family protein [Candidatus Riflebacteria bacterium]
MLVLPRQGLPVVALQATVQGDRRFDPEDRAGLAEFTGKMLQEGCEGKSSYDIASAIEAVGGTLESDDEGITAQGLSRDLPLLLDIVSGCLSTPTFPADRVAHIKAKTMAEIESDEDDPATVGSRAFHELVYEGHPYHHPSVGYKRTVQAITRDDLVAHHGRTYSPTGTLLAIVGEVDPLAIRSQVEKAFGRWKPREVSLAKVPAIERQAGPKLRAIFMDKEQLNIYLGHLGVRRSNPDYYSLQVMDNILGTSPGFADRMSRILRDEMGLAYHVRANITGTSGLEPGAFTAYIGTSPRNRRTSVEEMTRLIREICEVPVSPAELKDAKDYLTGSFVFKFETASQLASFLVDAERYQLGDDYLARYPELINEVSVADVTRVARQYLAPGAFSTVIVGPVDEKGELKAPAKK